jgi:hypothetical protein
MEFRGPSAVKRQYEFALEYLTKNLSDPSAGKTTLDDLVDELGPCVDDWPQWHPVYQRAKTKRDRHLNSINDVPAFEGADHTRYFVRGFVTCPYSEEVADRIVNLSRRVDGIHAYKLPEKLYSDDAFPVVVESYDLTLEPDGTIKSRQALAWFLEWISTNAKGSEVAETWWNIRSYLLGEPHGSRSSICVNQHVGSHMRKILEALNESGVFGPILESSLDMLPKSKRDRIGRNVIEAALSSWDGESESTSFDLRGESCIARIRDTFGDGDELSIRVNVGNDDLFVSGFHYPKSGRMDLRDPTGRRQVAEKFT